MTHQTWNGDRKVKFSTFSEKGRRNSHPITEGVEWGTQIAEIGAENGYGRPQHLSGDGEVHTTGPIYF